MVVKFDILMAYQSYGVVECDTVWFVGQYQLLQGTKLNGSTSQKTIMETVIWMFATNKSEVTSVFCHWPYGLH
jgi:hypothetical protein